MISCNLLSCLALIIISVSLGVSQAEVFDPYVAGPYSVLYRSYEKEETGLEKNLGVWGPAEGGNFPVIVFSGSLAGNVPGHTSVITVIERVVSYGLVT